MEMNTPVARVLLLIFFIKVRGNSAASGAFIENSMNASVSFSGGWLPSGQGPNGGSVLKRMTTIGQQPNLEEFRIRGNFWL